MPPCTPFTSPQFGYQTQLDVDTAQMSFIEEKVTPMNGISGTDPYDFVFEPKGDSFLCMDSMYLTGQFQILRQDTNSPPDYNTQLDNADVAPINLLGQTLWQSIETRINDYLVLPQSGYNVCYKAYMETLLSYEARSADRLWANFYYDDTPGQLESMNGRRALIPRNVGHWKRHHDAVDEDGSGFTSPICNDFLRSMNHLAPGNKLALRFYRNSDAFVLNYTGGEILYKLKLTDLAIHCRRIKVQPKLLPLIVKPSAKQYYQSNHSHVRNFALPTGVQHWRGQLGEGILPKHVVVALVATDAYVGRRNKNPLNFQHFNVNRINLVVNNQRVPKVPLAPDFTQGLIARELYHLHQNTGKLGGARSLNTGRVAFQRGRTFFPFDLTPDACNGYHTHAGKEGKLEVEIDFARATTESVTMLVMCTNDLLLSIDPSKGGAVDTHLF